MNVLRWISRILGLFVGLTMVVALIDILSRDYDATYQGKLLLSLEMLVFVAGAILSWFLRLERFAAVLMIVGAAAISIGTFMVSRNLGDLAGIVIAIPGVLLLIRARATRTPPAQQPTPFQAPPCAAAVPPASPVYPVRPKTVTVFGILNIVFAGMALFSALVQAVTLFVNRFTLYDQSAVMVMIFSLLTGFVLNLLLLSTGIGLLVMKTWARIAAVVYACLAIVMALLTFVLTIRYTSPDDFGVDSTVGLIGLLINLLWTIAYSVLLLIFMNTHLVKAAFRATQDAQWTAGQNSEEVPASTTIQPQPPLSSDALPADAHYAVLSLLESNLGWPDELNRAYFAGVDLVALQDRILKYQTMPHPQGFTAMLSAEKVYPHYTVDSQQIRRVGSVSEDAKLCSVATCLRGRLHGMDQRTCDNAFEAIKRYAELPLSKFLFSVPTAYAAVTTGQFPSEDERIINLYKGVENILFEIYEELEEGQVMTDQVVTCQLLSIAYGVKYAPVIFESLQRCYETELAKIRENPQYLATMKNVFRELEQPERIEDIMSVVVEKMGEARDGQSHSRQLQPASLPVMVSVSVWPQCTLPELAERFQQEIGVPYMEAAGVYMAKYGAMGAKAYIHLFFCYNNEESGVAIAFVACDEDYGRQTGMILPESIKHQTDALLGR